MDISQILPLLLKGDDNDQKSKLMASMLGGGGSREDILASMAGSMGGGGGAADILSQMKGGSGGSADMMTLMNMLKMNQQKNKTSDKYEGLKTITDFAPPDILGTLYKMLG